MSDLKTDIEINDYINKHVNVIYKKTSNDIGMRYNEGGKEKKHTVDGKFTKVK